MKRAICMLVMAAMLLAASGCGGGSAAEVDIPVLMYHHLSEEGDYAVRPDKFRQDMEDLLAAGYTPVFYEEIYDFVTGDGSLPEKPVVITFDDGYASNYLIAYREVLTELEIKAEISVIGWSVGLDSFPDTGVPITPHFGWAEAREMDESGLVRIQNHSYDLHYEGEDETQRRGMLPLDWEDEETYFAVITDDLEQMMALIEEKVGRAPLVTTYPGGLYSEALDELVATAGYPISVTTDYGIHTFVQGDERSLRLVKRISCDGEQEDILTLIGLAEEFERERAQ